MKLFIIFNPNAGKAAIKRLNWIQDFFESSENEVTLFFSRKRGETRLLAKELAGRNPDRIIVAGGDGTISEVLDGLKGTNIPLGVIPLGTSNVFALETGIPISTQAACELIKTGKSRKIHLGTANGRGFTLMASVGFDAEVIYRLSSHYRKNPGKTMYFVEVLKGLLTGKTGAMTVTVETGQQYRCYGMLASNTKSFGGKILFCPDRGVEEESLEVCLFLKPGPLHTIKSLLTLGFLRRNRQQDSSELLFLNSKKLVVATDEPSCHVQADGDIISHTPCTIEFLPNTVEVIMPEQRVEQDDSQQEDQPSRSRRRSPRSRRPRYQGDRPQGDRPPQGERPQQGDRPQAERPQNDRPQQQGERPQGELPQGDRPQGDRPQGDRPQGYRRPRRRRRPRGGNRPQGERPQGDRPQGERPQGENNREQQGSGERQSDGQQQRRQYDGAGSDQPRQVQSAPASPAPSPSAAPSSGPSDS